jgi:hypothetical protein
LTYSPCGSSLEGLPDMMDQYTYPVISLSVNASVNVICRMNNATLANLYVTFFNTSVNDSTVIGSQSWLARYTFNASLTGGNYGYVWAIDNNNYPPTYSFSTSNDLYVKWAIGNFTPPNGTVNHFNGYPLPYPYPNGTISISFNNMTSQFTPHDVVISTRQRRFFFSMTTDPQKMYGTFQQFCTSSNCTEFFPMDPPILSDPYGWSHAVNATELMTYPECECGVNVACQLGTFLFTVDLGVNYSDFLISPEPPGVPLSFNISYAFCVPKTEECNGFDDDCNGIVDDIQGVNKTCGFLQLNSVGICKNGITECPDINYNVLPNQTQNYYDTLPAYRPLCVGQIIPVEEICNGIDDNCDGIIDNIPVIICGNSTIGACNTGYLKCNSTTNQSYCSGNIDPISEICGDNIDNDCDGIIDNGCVSILGILNYGKNNGVQQNNVLWNALLVLVGNKESKIDSAFDPDDDDDDDLDNETVVKSLLYLNIDNTKTSTNSNSELVNAYDVIQELYDLVTRIYMSLWVMVLSLLIVTICVCIMCACGYRGGCFYNCSSMINNTPWDTYGPDDELVQDEEQAETENGDKRDNVDTKDDDALLLGSGDEADSEPIFVDVNLNSSTRKRNIKKNI